TLPLGWKSESRVAVSPSSCLKALRLHLLSTEMPITDAPRRSYSASCEEICLSSCVQIGENAAGKKTSTTLRPRKLESRVGFPFSSSSSKSGATSPTCNMGWPPRGKPFAGFSRGRKPLGRGDVRQVQSGPSVPSLRTSQEACNEDDLAGCGGGGAGVRHGGGEPTDGSGRRGRRGHRRGGGRRARRGQGRGGRRRDRGGGRRSSRPHPRQAGGRVEGEGHQRLADGERHPRQAEGGPALRHRQRLAQAT